MLKRVISAIMCLCFLLTIAACGDTASENRPSEKKQTAKNAVKYILEGFEEQTYATYMQAFDPEDTLKVDRPRDEKDFNQEIRSLIDFFGGTGWDASILSVDKYLYNNL